MINFCKKKKKAFTLLELIITVAIGSILLLLVTDRIIFQAVNANNTNNKVIDLNTGVKTTIDEINNTLKSSIQVHLVGKINRNIYRCITEDIVTDDVIITENQMQHILDRHPEAYKEVIDYLSDIIQEPDLIIKDKHKNTGLVVKKIKTGNEYAQMVLRICTSNDDPNYKNSVISCWEISEKRLQNYLRNKTILYKKE